MPNGINIKNLPEVNSVSQSDKFIFERYVAGTQIVAFSSIVFEGNQVGFYNDFLSLSTFTFSNFSSLSSALNVVSTNVKTISTNLAVLSADFAYNIFFLNLNQNNTTNTVSSLNTSLNTVSANLKTLSSDHLDDFSKLDSGLNFVSGSVDNLSGSVFSILDTTSTFLSGGLSPSGAFVPQKVGIFYLAADTKDVFVSIDTATSKDWKRILTVDY